MDKDVAQLAREEHLVAAAELAASRGQSSTASLLFERACEWTRAATEALADNDHARALLLAATAGDDETGAAALRGLETAASEQLRSIGGELDRQGRHSWAARTYEAAGDLREAAIAWERSGNAIAAAALFERLHNVTYAARLLEAGLRRDPDRVDLQIALGGLLLRHGKAEAALRVLQQVPDGAPQKREALRLSLPALEQLGLTDALAEATHLLTGLGGEQPEMPGPPERPDERVRARLYGRYEVVREVASTATARVVECLDTVRDERVAIKIFSAQGAAGSGRDALARFAREARVLRQLAHPNVVPLREVLEPGPALVLAWMPGGTLETRLLNGALAPARAAEVARSVLQALGEAHRLGIVHRDIKPANVLFDAAGGARLSDFGVSHLGDLSVTATAGVVGSVAYMSPEQREGRPASAASDIFGVGAIFYEMLTGQRPAANEKTRPPAARFHRHLDARHDAVLDALLAHDPMSRPPDAFGAATLIDAIAWPMDVDRDARAALETKPASMRPTAQRLESDGTPGVLRDRWLDRLVASLPLSDAVLARARVFSQVGGPELQLILRVDRIDGEIWLAPPRGTPAPRLERPALALLERALLRLHAAGFVHGSVERSVVAGPDGPVLLFSESLPDGATPEADLAALEGLSRS